MMRELELVLLAATVFVAFYLGRVVLALSLAAFLKLVYGEAARRD